MGAELITTGAPTTLVLGNATTSGVRELWMQVDVASDANFQTVLHQADRIALNAAGRTSYTIPQALGPGNTYFWRARALDGANTGPYSTVAHFSIVEPVVIETPAPMEPSALSTNRPTFRARNARISGPAGGVVYRFEVATALDPAAIIAVVSTAPGTDGTTRCHWASCLGQTFYWRVRDKRLYDQHAVRRRFFHDTSSAHGSSAPITDATATSTTTATARRRSGWSAAKHFTERSPADRSSRPRQ